MIKTPFPGFTDDFPTRSKDVKSREKGVRKTKWEPFTKKCPVRTCKSKFCTSVKYFSKVNGNLASWQRKKNGVFLDNSALKRVILTEVRQIRVVRFLSKTNTNDRVANKEE